MIRALVTVALGLTVALVALVATEDHPAHDPVFVVVLAAQAVTLAAYWAIRYRAVRLLLVAAIVLALAACAQDGGTVTRTRRTYVCVRPDDGGLTLCHKRAHSAVVRCHVGDRWPDCIKRRH
jgi:hypothetical protein